MRNSTQRNWRAARHGDFVQTRFGGGAVAATGLRDRQAVFLNCPRCGLSIRQKSQAAHREHCPRCLARAQMPVRLFVSTRPTTEWYRYGSGPYAEHPRTGAGPTG